MRDNTHDVAIVLGAGVAKGGLPSRALLRRAAHAVALYQSGRVPCLLMSGGVGRYPPAEAVLMRDAALAAGVPEAALRIEPLSRDTLENAAFCKPIVAAEGWRRVLLVSDGYHLPRALYTFRHLGIPADGDPAPAPGPLLAAHCREVAAFLTYLWRVERAARLLG